MMRFEVHTQFIISGQRLVMLPPQFRPLCKVVLRTDRVHLFLEIKHFPLEYESFSRIFARGQREPRRESP